MQQTVDIKTAFVAAYRFIEMLDKVVPSEDLKMWLGAMRLSVDEEPMDAAMMEYWLEAVETAVKDMEAMRKAG